MSLPHRLWRLPLEARGDTSAITAPESVPRPPMPISALRAISIDWGRKERHAPFIKVVGGGTDWLSRCARAERRCSQVSAAAALPPINETTLTPQAVASVSRRSLVATKRLLAAGKTCPIADSGISNTAEDAFYEMNSKRSACRPSSQRRTAERGTLAL